MRATLLCGFIIVALLMSAAAAGYFLGRDAVKRPEAPEAAQRASSSTAAGTRRRSGVLLRLRRPVASRLAGSVVDVRCGYRGGEGIRLLAEELRVPRSGQLALRARPELATVAFCSVARGGREHARVVF